MTKEILEIEGKFLSAEELNLTEDQRCGLIKTLAYLEHGLLDQHLSYVAATARGRPSMFDMNHWGGECGTACCIGGTAEALMRNNHLYTEHRADKRATELYRLFYPSDMDSQHPGWRASPSQAAVALRGYLETGRANWTAATKTPKYQKQRRKD